MLFLTTEHTSGSRGSPWREWKRSLTPEQLILEEKMP